MRQYVYAVRESNVCYFSAALVDCYNRGVPLYFRD